MGRLSAGLPTEQEFYELINSYLLRLLKTTDLMEQDAICNELVSNLRAGDNCVSVIKLKPPYDLMTVLDEISTGRDKQIHLELLDFIIYEPAFSDRLLNHLEDIFNSVKMRKITKGVSV